MDKFLDITIGNVVTWVLMLLSLAAMWQKLKDQVKALAEQMKSQSEIIKQMQDSGSSASREAVGVIHSRLESQADRIKRMEDAMIAFGSISSDVNWIKNALRDRNKL